jgi:hypothetical protein
LTGINKEETRDPVKGRRKPTENGNLKKLLSPTKAHLTASLRINDNRLKCTKKAGPLLTLHLIIVSKGK